MFYLFYSGLFDHKKIISYGSRVVIQIYILSYSPWLEIILWIYDTDMYFGLQKNNKTDC